MPHRGTSAEESYQELRRIARRVLSRERPSSFVHATSLAHQAWIKLVDRGDGRDGPPHFGTVVRVMRAAIVDRARREKAAKRGGGWRRVPLTEGDIGREAGRGVDVLEFEEALLGLEKSHPREAQVLELRVFGGLGTSQTAALLRLSDRTVEEDLRFARAMLRVKLDPL